MSSHVFSQSYLWPTNASQLLSSSFGEYRPDHFHAGIDFKTWGKTGYPIYAIENGSVIRMRVSPYGYGKALYFQLENGFIVVFGHLSGFNDRLNPFVDEAQEKYQQYKIDLSFPEGQLRFNKGDILGFTGRTGIGVPHLHFEVRDGSSPINPLYLGYPIRDHIRPVIQACAVSLKSSDGHVNGDILPYIAKAQYVSPGNYQLTEPVYCDGDIGFAVSCYDQADDAYNKLAVYRICLSVDGIPIYSTQYDRFHYDETGLIEIERDYRLNHWGLGHFQKLYREPENTLKISWPIQEKAGIRKYDASFANSSSHSFEIIVGDFFGNESRLKGQLVILDKKSYLNQNQQLSGHFLTEHPQISHQIIDDKIRFEVQESYQNINPAVWAWSVGNSPKQILLDSIAPGSYTGYKSLSDIKSGLYIINYDLRNQFTGELDRSVESFCLYHIDKQSEVLFSSDSLFSIVIRNNSFYQPYWGYVSKDTSRSSCYFVYPDDVPLKKSIELRFQFFDKDSSLIPKLGVYQINGKGESGFIGNQFKGSMLTARTRKLGKYQVLADTVPPDIHWMYPNDGQWLKTSRPVLSVSFEDILSGISGEENYRFYVDGKMMIVALDPEENLGMSFIKEPLTSGRHEFVVHLKDNASNETIRKHIFYTP